MDFFKKRIYLDYVSSTPLDKAMLGTFPRLHADALLANPSALHKEGQAAKNVLSDARTLVARTLFAHADEIVFTANATESDNLAVSGTFSALRRQGVASEAIAIVTTDSEHAAVLETVTAVGPSVSTYILPTTQGEVDPTMIIVPEGIQALIISVHFVNNETGIVQDIKAIAKRVRYLRKTSPQTKIIFHTDATQAPLCTVLNVAELGIDMMTLGATKLYCPKGVGLLYVRRDTPIEPVLHGGGQEFGLRPGTEAVALIHAFAHALAYAQTHVDLYKQKTRALQKQFESLIKEHVPAARITGSTLQRAPHISHVALENFDSELLVLELDARGIAVSAKSACKNDVSRIGREDTNESDIVQRIYGEGWGAIRVSFGRATTLREIRKAVAALVKVLEKYAQL